MNKNNKRKMNKQMQKIVVNISDRDIRETKAKVTNYLVLLDRAKDSLKNLTDDNVKDLSVKAVDDYLNNKTGFSNGLMSATAYNLQNEYKELVTLIGDVDSGSANLRFITKDQVDVKAIEEAFTSYLRDKHVEEYLRIKGAVDILNKTNITVLRAVLNLRGDRINFAPDTFEIAKQMR